MCEEEEYEEFPVCRVCGKKAPFYKDKWPEYFCSDVCEKVFEKKYPVADIADDIYVSSCTWCGKEMYNIDSLDTHTECYKRLLLFNKSQLKLNL